MATLERSIVQPNPGHGALCDRCRFQDFEVSRDFPCRAWLDRRRKVKPDVLRYSWAGDDVRVRHVLGRDFVEICSLFDEEAEEVHELTITALRDLAATCTCGRWSLLSPSTDAETDEMLRERAQHQFALHLKRMPHRGDT